MKEIEKLKDFSAKNSINSDEIREKSNENEKIEEKSKENEKKSLEIGNFIENSSVSQENFIKKTSFSPYQIIKSNFSKSIDKYRVIFCSEKELRDYFTRNSLSISSQ